VRVDREGEACSLLVDETFASYYRPGEVATRCVWDAIAAPLLWLPRSRRRRILILGLGGGSAARIARALAPEAEIVGVELDHEVVRLARRHLALDALGVRVEIADALAWLERDRSRYDAILEDVFVGRGDDVHKPDWIPEPAHRLAAARVARGGVLVSNTLEEHGRVERAMAGRFPAVVAIRTEDYDNRVLVGGGAGLDAAALRARVAAEPLLRDSLDVLSFRTRVPGGAPSVGRRSRRERASRAPVRA
jgi:predicted O-methyltransferase YrrM